MPEATVLAAVTQLRWEGEKGAGGGVEGQRNVQSEGEVEEGEVETNCKRARAEWSEKAKTGAARLASSMMSCTPVLALLMLVGVTLTVGWLRSKYFATVTCVLREAWEGVGVEGSGTQKTGRQALAPTTFSMLCFFREM